MDSTRLEIAGTLSLQCGDDEVRSPLAEIPLISDQVSRLHDEVLALKNTVEGSIRRGEERDSYASRLLTMLEKQSNDGFYKTFLQRPVEKLIELRELVLSEADTSSLDSHLVETLEAFNVRAVSAEPGASFDPTHQEAVDVVQVDDEAEDGLVVEVLRRGYLRGSELIRPARVRVAQRKQQEEAEREACNWRRPGDHALVGFGSRSRDRATCIASERRREVVDPHRYLVPPR